MCGIAIIVNGVRIHRSSLISHLELFHPGESIQGLGFSIDDLESALRRRGPDSLGTKRVFLNEVSSVIEGDESVYTENRSLISTNGRTHCARNFHAELHFIGAVLQLRGTLPIVQPLVDKSNNIMVFNGEIFGGINISKDENDTETLMRALENRSVEDSVVNVLSCIRGPWAVIYWQDISRTLWFGRDPFGRRSLLVHWPTTEDPRFLLSSVSPASHFEHSFDSEAEDGNTCRGFWEELPCGIYSITIEAPGTDGFLASEVRKHEWTDSLVDELIKWERTSVEPNPDELQISRCKSLLLQHRFQSASSPVSESGIKQVSLFSPAETVLIPLMESVRRRSSLYTIFQGDTDVEKALNPVAILFSGGLDSMILAVLLNECLESGYGIDLLNVSFDGELAPDRVSAKAGIKELRRIAPSRKWKLVEIDSSLSTLTVETKHVTSLISPANTYMDINIGIALWLAASGDGWVSEEHEHSSAGNHARFRYRSESQILLVGSGADEQCAGYGRHRTKFRNTSWLGLHEEMKLDIQRIWKRNLGRDDRCIADSGKEARFPFLDEDVIKALLDFPLWEVADLDQPSGVGDKKILREVAQLLGIREAASLPKRAIQFGSRIARESNRKNFGSNRAANHASAGSVVFR